MSIGEADDFSALIARVRAADQAAAAELVRRYEPLIRREVRLKLENSRLRRVLDSMDVCQSVLASFFVRAAAGQYDLDQPGPARQIAGNDRPEQGRVGRATRVQSAPRWPPGRCGRFCVGCFDRARSEPDGRGRVAELLNAFRAGLTPDERHLVDLRGEGSSWAEIATRLGGTADARRVQLGRAIDRVARLLNIDDGSPGHD